MQRLNLGAGRPQMLETPDAVLAACASFREKGVVAIDTETTGLDIIRDAPLFVSMSDGERRVALRVGSEEFAALESLVGDPQTVKIFHNCLTGDSRVWKADGTRKTLSRMVAERDPGPVYCLNEKTGQVEVRPVVGWVNNPPREWKDWLRIRVRGKGCLRLTKDHEVLTERGRVRADRIQIGDRIRTTRPNLSAAERSLIYGSLLGDMSIRRQKGAKCRSPMLVVSHASGQFPYLSLKQMVFNGSLGAVLEKPSFRHGGFSNSKGTLMARLRTQSDPRLLDVENACLRQGKKTLTQPWLERLDVPAVAIWICDDGSTQGCSMNACVTALGKTGAGQLAANFRKRGWPARIVPRKDGHLYLRISGSQGPLIDPRIDRFWEQVAPYIPTCMSYKAPKKYQHLCSDSYWYSSVPDSSWSDEVTEVGPLLRKSGTKGRYRGYSPRKYRKGLRQYCLTVAGHSNFFAEGLAVSNCKFDVHMLANVGMKVKGPWHDTLVMATMSDTSRSSKRLKDLLVSLYGPDDERSIRYSDFSETFGKVTKKKTAKQLLESAPIEKVLQYATCDAWGTFQIYQTLQKQLKRIHNWRGQDLWQLYTSIEVPFTEVLWGMERRGAKIDVGKLEQLREDWTKEIQDTELKFAQAVGRPININSVPQLRDYFLLERGLKTIRRTVGGESGEAKASLDKVTMGMWVEQGVTEAALVLRYRQLSKLVGTYADPLLKFRDTNDRVHTSYTQMVDTGRLASDEPNLQNIPARSKDGKKIRECFIADDGFELLVRDYDQLEMKLAAALSGDPNMIKIILEGKDIHSGNAAIAFDIPYEGIIAASRAKDTLGKAAQAGLPGEPLTDEQVYYLVCRDRAKTIGFETLYGGGIRKLAVLLKCSVDKAIEIQTKFFAPFQVLLKFIERTHQEARSTLSVQTITGRFRTLPAAALDKTPAQAEAYRQSFNTKIQGSGADAVKLAMILVWFDATLQKLGNQLELQVHDELVNEVPKETGEEIDRLVGEHMQHSLESVGLKLAVPLTSSGKRAQNWAAAK